MLCKELSGLCKSYVYKLVTQLWGLRFVLVSLLHRVSGCSGRCLVVLGASLTLTIPHLGQPFKKSVLSAELLSQRGGGFFCLCRGLYSTPSPLIPFFFCGWCGHTFLTSPSACQLKETHPQCLVGVGFFLGWGSGGWFGFFGWGGLSVLSLSCCVCLWHAQAAVFRPHWFTSGPLGAPLV